jgi:hypothetical protein
VRRKRTSRLDRGVLLLLHRNDPLKVLHLDRQRVIELSLLLLLLLLDQLRRR